MSAESGNSNARCPRCGGPFHCGAAEAHCPCATLKLDEALRRRLVERFGSSSCLCLGCLAALQAQPDQPAR
jgi:hypothetical protein